MVRAGLSFDTKSLRDGLKEFLDTEFQGRKIGSHKFGVYAFYDYDGEPIYVGQTNEKIGTRIRKHLTNQRTDAVAMSVLDPYEVKDIEVWPLPRFQNVSAKDKLPGECRRAKEVLDALECTVFQNAIEGSQFGAVLNEKEPNDTSVEVNVPRSYRSTVVSRDLAAIRDHPDVRIARRALTISKLAQAINERRVSPGLRDALVTQSKRLLWLAERRSGDFTQEP